MKRITKLILFFFSLCLSCTATQAKEEDEHAHHQQETHVHGIATLNIVLESTELLIELETPAMNVLGFEHAPRTDEQRAIVVDAEVKFNDISRIINLSHSDCDLNNVDIESPDFPVIEDAHEEHQEHEHEEHNHGEHEHSEFHVSYALTCPNTKMLKSIEVKLFDTFPGFKEISTQWIFNSEQGAQKLTPTASSIKIP